MTNTHLIHKGGASIKGQRYFAEIHLPRGVRVPIYRENRGVTENENSKISFAIVPLC